MNTYPFKPQIHRVIWFKIVGDYAIHLIFDDQTEQTIDFESILVGPVFGPLRDKALFSQVTLDKSFGALAWPNGADISPAVLYEWPEHVPAIIAHRQRETLLVN